jgi:hypothetical protein
LLQREIDVAVVAVTRLVTIADSIVIKIEVGAAWQQTIRAATVDLVPRDIKARSTPVTRARRRPSPAVPGVVLPTRARSTRAYARVPGGRVEAG